MAPISDDRLAPGPLLRRTKAGNAPSPNSLVRVAVRLRPSKLGEGKDAVSVEDAATVRVEDPTGEKRQGEPGFCRSGGFTVDHAFGPSAPTDEIYSDTVQRLVRAVVRDSTNGCCFAYGATGSGKTFTMEGTEASPGVMQLAIRDLFSWADPEATVVASYFQIYNEQVTDLLRDKADDAAELAVRMDADGHTHVVGLRESAVASADGLLKLVADGGLRRASAATAVNEASSRSHAVLQITLHQPSRGSSSKLSLIDLAGSERATRANTAGQALVEGRMINHSLLALSKCIRARVCGTRPNYRESKLTRLLEDSLSGSAATTMICACSPAAATFDETLQTLSRANEVKQIKRPAVAPPLRSYLAPPPPPPPIATSAAVDAPSAPSVPPPLRGLRGSSSASTSSITAAPAGGPSAEPSAQPSPVGPPPELPSHHPREVELVALLDRVRAADDARFAIFLRASNALLDGLEESYARLDEQRVQQQPPPPPPPLGHHHHHQLPPAPGAPGRHRRASAANPAPLRRTPSPLDDDEPSPLADAPNPIAGALGLIHSRDRRNAREPTAAAADGRPSSAGDAAPPPPESAALPLMLASPAAALHQPAACVTDEQLLRRSLPPLGGSASRPATPPGQPLAPPPLPPLCGASASHPASQHASKPASRLPTPPSSHPSSRVASRNASPKPARAPRNDKAHVAARGGGLAPCACVSACVPSADGVTTYHDVGYRSPPGVDVEGAEALS